MRIVTFADANYAQFASNLIQSLVAHPELSPQSISCYAIGDHLAIENRDGIWIPFSLPKGAPRPNYFKPRVLLDCLDRFPNEERFCYLDADMIVGRRLCFDSLLQGLNFNFPLAPTHLYEVPLCDIEGTLYSPSELCEYFNVPVAIDTERNTIHGNSCRYTQNCVIVFHRRHRDFLEEWQSWCENRYLWKQPRRYFQYQDETAFNVLLWKRCATETLGYIHTTLNEFSAFERGESVRNVTNTQLQPTLSWSWCADSGRLMFYHGTKIQNETRKMLDHLLRKQSGRQ